MKYALRLLLHIAVFLAVIVSPAFAQRAGTDTAPGASCAGSVTGAVQISPDPTGNSATAVLVCNGTTWEAAGLQLGNDAAACTAAKDGTIRYVSGGSPPWQYCDGGTTSWVPFRQPRCQDDGTGECFLDTTRANDDPQFTAANIASGVNILGVTGTFTGGSSCDNSQIIFSTPGHYSYPVPQACSSLEIEAFGAGGGFNRGGGGAASAVLDGPTLLVVGGGGGGGSNNDGGGGGGYGTDTIAISSLTENVLTVYVGSGGGCGMQGGGGTVPEAPRSVGGFSDNFTSPNRTWVGSIAVDLDSGYTARSGDSTYGGTGGAESGAGGTARAGNSIYGGGGGARSSSGGPAHGGDSTYGGGGGAFSDGTTSLGSSTHGNSGTSTGGGGGGGFPTATAILGGNGDNDSGGTAANGGPGNGGGSGCTAGGNGQVIIQPTSPSMDPDPDPFSFTDLTDVAVGAIIESEIIQITGIDFSDVSISGDGSPQYRLCADSACLTVNHDWGTSGFIDNGEYIQLRLTASSNSTTLHSASVNIGNESDQWDVTTGISPVVTFAEDFEDAAIDVPLTGTWAPSTTWAAAGSYSGRAATIGNSQTTSLTMTLEVCSSGNVTFDWRVSSEAGFDYFRFRVDGSTQLSQSGTNSGSHSGPITAGSRTLTWEYSKDSSVAENSDTAWVDNISVPNVVLSGACP